MLVRVISWLEPHNQPARLASGQKVIGVDRVNLGNTIEVHMEVENDARPVRIVKTIGELNGIAQIALVELLGDYVVPEYVCV